MFRGAAFPPGLGPKHFLNLRPPNIRLIDGRIVGRFPSAMHRGYGYRFGSVGMTTRVDIALVEMDYVDAAVDMCKERSAEVLLELMLRARADEQT